MSATPDTPCGPLVADDGVPAEPAGRPILDVRFILRVSRPLHSAILARARTDGVTAGAWVRHRLLADLGLRSTANVAIRRFIDEHLVDVDVPMLTARFGLSRTPLYRLFAKDGGVCAYIRDRRLAGAMRRLGQPGERRPKIARLAHECGFGNELVFSRAFRRKYGINPSDVAPGRPASSPPGPDAPLLGWLREL